jgi:hypothetical protein
MLMRTVKEQNKIDGVADPGDCVNVEVQERPNGLILYVHVNGETILRIGQLQQEVEFQRVGHFEHATGTALIGAYEEGVKDGISRAKRAVEDGLAPDTGLPE